MIGIISVNSLTDSVTIAHPVKFSFRALNIFSKLADPQGLFTQNRFYVSVIIPLTSLRFIPSDFWRLWMIPGDSSESYWWTQLSNFQNQSLRFYWIKLIPHMTLTNLSTSHWFWIDYKYGKSLILPVHGPLADALYITIGKRWIV